jgi:hypothetical protein
MNCVVCGSKCKVHKRAANDDKGNVAWVEDPAQLPTYYALRLDKLYPFCSSRCALKWYEKSPSTPLS